MHQSLTIAKLVGPVLSAIGIYVSGVLMLVAGLNAHPVWTRDWRSTVTAIGWFLTGVGTLRITAPQFANSIGGAIIAKAGFVTGLGIVLLVRGGLITFKGYVA
jgi:hypothetical protein